MDGGPLDLPYLHIKARAILERDFTPSFKLKHAAKDARLVTEAAERHHVEVPLARVIRDQMAQGVPEHGDEDLAATYLTSAPSRPGS